VVFYLPPKVAMEEVEPTQEAECRHHRVHGTGGCGFQSTTTSLCQGKVAVVIGEEGTGRSDGSGGGGGDRRRRKEGVESELMRGRMSQ